MKEAGAETILSKPYLLSREQWALERERLRPDGNAQKKYFKGSGGSLDTHIKRITALGYGVHEWLINKALNGCQDSLFKIEYGYDTYSEVINKAKEEGAI